MTFDPNLAIWMRLRWKRRYPPVARVKVSSAVAPRDLTKSYIADTFTAFALEGAYERVTVRDVTERCGINRKTFYYHFTNKADLVCYIFRRDLARLLNERFPHSILMATSRMPEERHSGHSFCLRDEVMGPRFLLAFSDYFKENEAFYRKVFRSRDWGQFYRYIFGLYEPEVLQEITTGLESRGVDLCAEEVDYLSAYFTNATVVWVINRHVTKSAHYSEDTKQNLSRIMLDAVDGVISGQADQVSRRTFPASA